jgi:hypothetical protein
MTSVKPAARCQLLVKERMLLTPPMSVRAVRRLVTEDLGFGVSCVALLRYEISRERGAGVPPTPEQLLGPLAIVAVRVGAAA